ncbi:MAG: NAD(P)-binding domain-containing protein, partial [Spirochaetota bacterium]|nr:NAD(P)-binding domain-containing protein [Spirochaetota bacterium]
KRRALLIGAGEMGELILKYLSKYNICDITIANRSFHNAEKIAKEINRGINIIPLDDIPETVLKADIIISSISPTNYIIPYDMAKNALKRKNVNSPTFFIDIAVPRSIDPKIAKLDKMFLYNIDDLKSIADDNLKSRLKEVELAKRLIEMDTDDFYKWYKGLSVVPAIIKIQDRFNEIRTHELNKYRRRKLKHITEEDFKIIEDLTNQIMTKTLHNPITYLKSCLEQCNNKFDDEVDDILEKKKIIEDLFAYENGDE